MKESEMAMARTRPEKSGTGGRANAKLEPSTTTLLGGTAKLRAFADKLTEATAIARRAGELAEVVTDVVGQVDDQLAQAADGLALALTVVDKTTAEQKMAEELLGRHENALNNSNKEHDLVQKQLIQAKKELDALHSERSLLEKMVLNLTQKRTGLEETKAHQKKSFAQKITQPRQVISASIAQESTTGQAIPNWKSEAWYRHYQQIVEQAISELSQTLLHLDEITFSIANTLEILGEVNAKSDALERQIRNTEQQRDQIAGLITSLREKANTAKTILLEKTQAKQASENCFQEAQQHYSKLSYQLSVLVAQQKAQEVLKTQAEHLREVAQANKTQQVHIVDALHNAKLNTLLSPQEMGKFFDIQSASPQLISELVAVLSAVMVKMHSSDIVSNKGVDDLLAFMMVYQAVAQSSGGDVVLASRTLQELMQSSLASFIGAPKANAVSEYAKKAAQVLAPLPRGMEILTRLTTGLTKTLQTCENEAPNVAAARKQAVREATTAISVYLQASAKYASDAGTAVTNTQKMLANAIEAATLVFANAASFNGQAIDMRAGLSDDQKAAFQAVHCKYFSANEGSQLRKTNKYLEKASTRWVDFSIQDNNAEHLRSTVATAGKLSPFKPTVLSLSQKVESLYSLVDGETGARLDGHLECASATMVAVMKRLLAERERIGSAELLEIAAIAYALKTTKDEQGNQICRPEHTTMPSFEHGGRQALFAVLTKQFRLSPEEANDILNAEAVCNHPATKEYRSDGQKMSGVLKTENLVRVWDRLQVSLTDRVPAQDVKTIETALRKASEIVAQDPPVQIGSRADVQKFLNSIPQRIEPRGATRLIESYTGGVKIPLSGAVTIATGIVTGGASMTTSVQPRLKLKTALTKSVIFEMSLTTESLDIFIGREKRISGTAGLGVGAKIGLIHSKIGVGAGAGCLHSRTGENNNKEGVWLRLPVDTSSTEELRDEAQKIMDTLFNWRDMIDEASKEKRFGDEVGGIPNPLGAILAINPKVSVNLVQREEDKITKISTALDGAVGVLSPRIPLVQKLGIGMSLGNEYARVRKQTIAVDSGYFSIHRNKVQTANQIALAIPGLALYNSATMIPSQHSGDVGGTLGVIGGGHTRKVLIRDDSIELKNRWVVMDGETHWKHSRIDIEYRDFVQFKNAVNAQRETWIALGATKRIGMGIPLEAAREAASKDLDAFLDELERRETDPDGIKRQRNSFIISRCMREESAAHLDGLLALEQLAIQRGDVDEARRLNAQQDKVFRNEQSYQDLVLFVMERTKQKQAMGIDFGVHVSHNIGAEGQRPEIVYS
jgi:hypothetical protein